MIKLIKTTLGTGHDGTLFVCQFVNMLVRLSVPGDPMPAC
jgi:hypothetical protein